MQTITTTLNGKQHMKLGRPDMVMLVDDSPWDLLINEMVCTHIKIFKKIISFDNGFNAWEYLSKNVDNTSKLPQLILCNIHMLEMDGFRFVDKCGKLNQSFLNQCHIAMLSSSPDSKDLQRVEAHPMITELLNKQLTPTKLLELIDTYYEI